MQVHESEFKSVRRPGRLETTKMGPCIGVGILWNNWGSILHTPDVSNDEVLVEHFFREIEANVPIADRLRVVPVLAGGCLDKYLGDAIDADLQEDTQYSRAEIVRKLLALGFPSLDVIWAAQDESHTLHIDFESNRVVRTTYEH